MSDAGFASVILDVDSTLCGLEGIDWLAERRGNDISAQVSALTDRAMRGEIPLDAVYGERLALVHPSRADIAGLADAYAASLAPQAAYAILRLRAAGRRLLLVSGGIHEAIVPMATRLGIPARDVFGVSVRCDSAGAYVGFDTTSPLATATGKLVVVESLALPRRILAMGDGATDLAMRPAVDSFAAYTGFIRRENVVNSADIVLASFDQLVELVLG